MPATPEYSEVVMQALLDHLAPLTATVTGLKIERNRKDPAISRPILLVDDGADDIDDSTWGKDIHQFGIEIAAFAADLAEARRIAALAHQLIAADVTLGGKAVDCRRAGRSPETAQIRGGEDLAAEIVTYSIEFWTKPGDPFQAAP